MHARIVGSILVACRYKCLGSLNIRILSFHVCRKSSGQFVQIKLLFKQEQGRSTNEDAGVSLGRSQNYFFSLAWCAACLQLLDLSENVSSTRVVPHDIKDLLFLHFETFQSDQFARI